MGTRKTRLCTTGANAPEGKQDADCSVSNGVFSLLLLWCFATELRATRHTSHVTRHTSHVTRHTSHVTRHTSHVTRHTSSLNASMRACASLIITLRLASVSSLASETWIRLKIFDFILRPARRTFELFDLQLQEISQVGRRKDETK